MGPPRTEFRRNLVAENVGRITSIDPMRRSFNIRRREVELRNAEVDADGELRNVLTFFMIPEEYGATKQVF